MYEPARIGQMLAQAKISRARPDISGYEGNAVVDMHVHSRYSDAFSRVTSIISKAEKLGIGISITDHNDIRGVMRAFALEHEVMVIPGIEVSVMEGPHVLAYFESLSDLKHFYERYVHPAKSKDPCSTTKLSIYDMLRICRTYKAVVSVAHPFGPVDTGIHNKIKKSFIDMAVLEDIDALEVMNGASTKGMNEKAAAFADRLGKAITGGSDAHSIYEIGSIVSIAKAKNVREYLYRIRKRQNMIVGRELGLKRIPSIAKSSQHIFSHPITAVKNRYEKMIKPHFKYTKTRAMTKVKSMKDGSVRLMKNPIRTTRKATKKAGRMILKARLK